jgi:uncharacterized membrane protein
MRRPAVIALTVAPFVLAACDRHASRADCDALLDHYVELLARQRDPNVSADFVQKKQAEARALAPTSESFQQCPREVTKRGAACALQAPNADELERCLE